jgi:predicted amidohydrolase
MSLRAIGRGYDGDRPDDRTLPIMRVTVCQLSNYGGILDDEWEALVDHVRDERSDLLLLPEMPFSRWLAADHTVVDAQWDDAVAVAADWLGVMPAFAPTAVVGSRPVNRVTGRRNGGYLVDGERTTDVHDKAYLPNEPGYWEARWYEPGEPAFAPFAVGDASVAMLICSELWSFEAARSFADAGVDLVAVPRATPSESLERWLVAGRAAAMTAGAFVASSNLYRQGGVDLGGMGFLVGPDGDLLATTDAAEPFATVDIDLTVARDAKATYPRYLFT